MTDQSDGLPKGLVSFAYHAIFNPVVNARARADLMQAMSKFGLSDEAKTLIFEAQTCGVPHKEVEEKLTALLAKELAINMEQTLKMKERGDHNDGE